MFRRCAVVVASLAVVASAAVPSEASPVPWPSASPSAPRSHVALKPMPTSLSPDARLRVSATPSVAAVQGHVTGRVTDRSGNPLAGADVDAYSLRTFADAHTRTAADGTYSLALAPGTVEVFASGSRAHGGSSDATGYQASVNVKVSLAAGDSRAGVDFQLAPGGRANFLVTDGAGHPLAGVPVLPLPPTPYVSQPEGILLSFAFDRVPVTNAAGEFTAKGLSGVGEQVCFAPQSADVTGGDHDAAGYSDACLATPLSVGAGSTVTLPTVILDPAPGGALTGAVTTPAGAAVSFNPVEIRGPHHLDEIATTDNLGHYLLGGLPAGSYRVCVQVVLKEPAHHTGYAPTCRAALVTVVTGHRVTGNVHLHLGGAILGRVVSTSGHPVIGADVQILQVAGSLRTESDAVTDTDGRYIARGLPRGRFTVCVDPSEASPKGNGTGLLARCYAHRKPVGVPHGAVRHRIDVTLSRGGAIAGRVVDQHGQPVAHVDVLAFATKGDDAYDGSTRADGSYILRGLAAGSYQVCFTSDDLSGSQSCHGGANPGRAKPVPVTVGRIARGVDGVLPTVSASSRTSLQVTVRDGAGRPLRDVDVAVLTGCSALWEECATEPLFSATKGVDVVDGDLTNGRGAVSFGDLAPGHYAVCLFAFFASTPGHTPATGYADTCPGGTVFDTVMRAGQTTTLTAPLALGGSVSGRITDASGHPLRGVVVHVSNSAADDFRSDQDVTVSLLSANYSDPRAYSVTAANGTFTIRGVTPGSQTVCVDAKGASGGSSTTGYRNQCYGGTAGSSTGAGQAVTAGADSPIGDLALTAR